jgi:hypothetical protein
MTTAIRCPFPVLLFVIILFTNCVGCGYNFRATGEPIGIKYDGLAIPLMTSTSSTVGFEADFTKIIRQEFITHARVSTEPLSYHTQNTYQITRSRRLRVKLDVSLIDTVTEKVIWHEGAMVEEASFIVGEDPLQNRYNEQQALESIARAMAKRIYSKTMERF